MSPAVNPRSALALYYFAVLGTLGFFWPLYPVFLSSLGLRPAQVTMVLAVTPAMGLLAPPLVGLLADARSSRGWILRSLTAATAVAFAGFFLVGNGRMALYATVALFAAVRAPLLPMADATTMAAGGSYGPVRMWGSVGFLAAALAGGQLHAAFGTGAWLAGTLVGLVAAAALAWALPAAAPARRPRAVGAWASTLREPSLWLFLGAVVLAQAANATYDACFSLHLARLGHGSGFIGAAWAVGTVAEVGLLLASGRILDRLGAGRAFALALAVGAGRWLLIPRLTTPALILLLQPLHAVTFGLYWVAGVTLARAHGAPEAPTAAQGLFAAAVGLGGVAGMVASGRLFQAGGGAVAFLAACTAATRATALALARERAARAARAAAVEPAVARGRGVA